MISQSAEYALRVVVCLATKLGVPATTVQLAAATRVPPFYLAKLMRTLVEAGVVSSRRGINGGFQLAKPADSLTLLEVIHAITPGTRVAHCPIDGSGSELCRLHRRLGECQDHMDKVLGTCTVAEILQESDPVREHCSLVEEFVAGAAQ